MGAEERSFGVPLFCHQLDVFFPIPFMSSLRADSSGKALSFSLSHQSNDRVVSCTVLAPLPHENREGASPPSLTYVPVAMLLTVFIEQGHRLQGSVIKDFLVSFRADLDKILHQLQSQFDCCFAFLKLSPSAMAS